MLCFVLEYTPPPPPPPLSSFSPNIMQEIQKKNEALLQMYGEKAELAEELKLDIQDLKEMYRQQIDTLTKR